MTLIPKEKRRDVRKDLGRVQRFVFLYALIFTIMTFAAMVAGVVPYLAEQPDIAMEKVQEILMQQSGVTSLTGLVFGVAFILINRRKALFTEDLRTPERRSMTARVFICCVVFFFTCQALYFVLDPIVRAVAGLFGYSLYSTGDSLNDAPNDLAMILYAGFLGPIVEEVVFRGVVMRGLAKYGKVFAIVTSAAMFGIFHGDIVQGFFAFCSGLMLGYVAMEFGIRWAMVLHIFNNFVLADLFARALAFLPKDWQDPAQIALILGLGVIGGALVLWKNRAAISDYRHANRTEKGVIPVLWTVPSFWLFVLMNLAMITMGFTKIG